MFGSIRSNIIKYDKEINIPEDARYICRFAFKHRRRSMITWSFVSCVFLYVLPSMCKGILIDDGGNTTESQRENDETCDTDIPYMGQLYLHLLQDLYMAWGKPIVDLALMTDTDGKDLAYAIMNKMDPEIEVLFKEKGNQDIVDLFSEMIYNTDTQNFVFIVSNTTYTVLIRQVLELNLDVPSRVWIFLSITEEDNLRYEVINLPCPMNVYFIGKPEGRRNGSEPGYRISIEECLENKEKFSVIQTLQWNSQYGIVHLNNVSRIPAKDVYLRVVGLHEAPFLYKNGEKFTGYHMDILDYISRSVGFKYKIYECDQSLYGYLNETTNNWSGCVSDLVYGRADLVAAPLHLVSKRKAVIDYIIPWTGYSGIIILAKQEARQNFSFFTSFTIELWSTVGLTFMLSCVLVFLFGKVLGKYAKPRDQTGQTNIDNNNINFINAVWFLISSSAFEGTRNIPKGHSIRILIAGFWVFINVFMSVFLGNVAAFLMSSSLKGEITSFSDLIKQHTVKFSCWRDSSISSHIHDMSQIEENMHDIWTRSNLDNETFFSAENTVWTYPLGNKYTKLWKGIVRSGFINTTGEALEKIKEGNFMFVTDSAVAEFLAGDNCNLQTIGRKISARPYGFGIRKFSSFKTSISRAYLNLQHLSLMHEIRRRWWKERDDCPGRGNEKGMNLSEMAGCFFAVCIGSVLGIIVLNIECFISRCKSARNELK